MTYQFFDPSNMNNMAKFQGSLAGSFSGHASHIGISQGPTSIYNQAGYFAIQDDDTGYVSLKKLADNSLYTNKWYDQSLDKEFDFTQKKTTFELSDLSNNMTPDEIAKLAK